MRADKSKTDQHWDDRAQLALVPRLAHLLFDDTGYRDRPAPL